MRRRRLIALCTAFGLLALAGGAGAASSPLKRPPSLLWKSYPLKQRTAASELHPFRPPALAEGTGSSSGGGIISPNLVLLALFGGAMLALTGLLAKSLAKDAAGIVTARKRRSGKPERASTEEAKPDMLVALRPASATVEEDPDLAEPRSKTPVIEGEDDVEPEQSDQVPSAPVRPLRILLPMEATLPEEEESKAESPPLRARPRPLLPIDQPPEVEAPTEEELPLPSEVAAETGPEPQSEPEPQRPWRETSREEDTEVAVESCQIMLWRGYVRYQLYAAPGGSSGRAFALSPYFRLKDAEAPGVKATAALQEILDQLEAEGWSVVLEGRSWYAFTLERPL